MDLFDYYLEPKPAKVEIVEELPIRPRDYQQRAIEKTFELFEAGEPGVIVRAPTGSGKTLTGTFIAHEWLKRGDKNRVLILAHERQLIQQFAEEVRSVLGNKYTIAIEMGDQHCTGKEDIVVASRQTLLVRDDKDEFGCDTKVSRLFKFDPTLNWLVVADEAHRFARKLKSCRSIVEYFEQNTGSRRLALTATPERTDKTSLAGLFPGVASDYRMYDPDGGPCALNDGWAVPYDQRFITIDSIDFKNIREVAKDFDAGQLEEILGEQETLAKMVVPMLDLVGNRQTIIFNAGTEVAKKVALYINAKLGKDVAVSLDGSYPDEARKDIYRRFEAKEFQFLSVCGLCLAKGTLVLTDQGEVPIQDVTLDMKLWDGVEFVAHDGVVCKGSKPVIEYAGLLGTEGHNVWTNDGWKTLAECKQEGLAIAVAGISGRPVQESDNYYRKGRASRKSATSGSDVQRMQRSDVEKLLLSQERQIPLQGLLPESKSTEQATRTTRSRNGILWQAGSNDQSTILQGCIAKGSGGSSLCGLRESLYSVAIGTENEPSGMQELHEVVGGSDVATVSVPCCKAEMRKPEFGGLPRLRRSRNQDELSNEHGYGALDNGKSWAEQVDDAGQDRQQRTLRTGQHTLCDKLNAGQEPEAAQVTEVYDIINAGPRHRFTANGLIVSNCREGYNNPGIQAVAIFRPTKSRPLAEQMKGRGCRPLRGLVNDTMTAEERKAAIAASEKATCMIIDLVGATGLGDCASTAHIFANGKPDEVIERANDNMRKKPDESHDVGEEIRRAEKELSEEREKARLEREAKIRREREEMEKRAKLAAEVRYQQRQVNSGHGAVGKGEKRKASMPFGKHKGEPIESLNTHYLKAFIEKMENLPCWLLGAIKKELNKRNESTKPPPPTKAKFVAHEAQVWEDVAALLRS